jgi:cell division septation protein DedD
VVQVSALKGRAEAETIRRRLAGKGYPAFVEAVGAGAAAVYRVRVGHYENRQAAAAIATRLEREERYKTWITR